jgi:hypothetical protein
LLLCRLRLHKSHFRPLSCDHDGLGVRSIVLLALNERFDIMRSNQLYLIDAGQELSERLVPGMSVIASIDVAQ